MHMLADPSAADRLEPYVVREARMNREYQEAFAKLSPARRAALQRHGIDGPEMNDPESHQGTRDVSEFVELAAPVPPANPRRTLADDIAEIACIDSEKIMAVAEHIERCIEAEVARRSALRLARTVGRLVREKNVKVSVMGLAFAADIDDLNLAGFPTMEAAATALGCSKAYVSQLANFWCDYLELPRPKSMKTAKARASYAAARLADDGHWRNQKCPEKLKTLDAKITETDV